MAITPPDPAQTEWVPVYNPVAVGPVGPQGPSGTAGLHAPTHSQGSTDPVTVTNLAGFPGGTNLYLRADKTFAAVPPGGTLPTNIAYVDVANIFTQDQAIQRTSPKIVLIDTSQPVDSRKFRIIDAGQFLYIQAVNDAETVASGAITVDRFGNIRADGFVQAVGLGTTPLNASNANAGTLPDARLSANVALTTLANIFTKNQEINGVTPILFLHDTSVGVDLKRWAILSFGGDLYFQARTDANGLLLNAFTFLRSGGLITESNIVSKGAYYEQGRAQPQGFWTDIPFNAANFGATGGGTWTMTAGAYRFCRYSVVGKMMTVSFLFVGSTVNAPAGTELRFSGPAGFTIIGGDGAVGIAYEPYNGYFSILGFPSTNSFSLQKSDVSGWGVGNVTLRGQISVQIQ